MENSEIDVGPSFTKDEIEPSLMKDNDEPSVIKVDVGLLMTELDDKPSLIKDWDEPSLIKDWDEPSLIKGWDEPSLIKVEVLVKPGASGGIFGLVKNEESVNEESANEESVKEDSNWLILLSKNRKIYTIEPLQDAVEICYKHALTVAYSTAF